MAEKAPTNWPQLFFSIYLLLVCFVAGIITLLGVADSAHEIVRLLFPEWYQHPPMPEFMAEKEKMFPRPIPQEVQATRQLVENAISILIAGGVYVIHWRLFAKVRKESR